MKKSGFFLLLILVLTLSSQTPSGKEILEKLDKNYTGENRVSITTMVIKERRGTRTLKIKTWAVGTEKAFSQYLEPPREKDTKMLKLRDELWIWTPSTDRVIRIAGHMLRQSMAGSDISYEDLMEDPKLSESYDVKMEGEEEINGRPCYVLVLTAKKEKIAYYRRKIWVDKETYLPLRQHLFAKSGKLLKKLEIIEIFKVKERWYPKKLIFKDVLKEGDGTEITIESIEFNVEIPDHIFTKASLRR